MTQIVLGERISREGVLQLGCCAVIFDARREKVLFTRRADNGLWCLPGGHMEPGESVAEACQREVLEETGLDVRVTRLIGVYSNTDLLVIYPQGRKVQIVVLSFEAEITSGSPAIREETTEVGFFSATEMESMPMFGRHKERAEDAFLNHTTPLIR
jgi:ADP-ribose pyrophosphatase YjhB (NUDIX family)